MGVELTSVPIEAIASSGFDPRLFVVLVKVVEDEEIFHRG